MKRALIVLAMLLMAATSYNQTSRRTTNANGSATRSTEKNAENQTRSTSTRSNVNSNQSNNQSQNRESNVTTEQKRTTNTSATRSNNTRTDSDNNNRQGSNSYQSNENNSRDNGNRNGNVNHDNNRGHNNNGYHDNANDRRSTNTVYVNHPSSRKYQHSHTVNYSYKKEPQNRDYRAVHYVYREPVHVDIIWTRDMHRHYIEMYPEVRYWNYNTGYRINTTSAYYADYYVGEVMNVYGQITDIFYAAETDEYFLYFGAYYPYHDFTVVLSGEFARRYSHRPMRYFMNQYINVTGLITVFDGKPEIVVKRNFQFELY